MDVFETWYMAIPSKFQYSLLPSLRGTVNAFVSGFPSSLFKGFATLEVARAEWSMTLVNGTWGPPHLQPCPSRQSPIMISSIDAVTIRAWCMAGMWRLLIQIL